MRGHIPFASSEGGLNSNLDDNAHHKVREASLQILGIASLYRDWNHKAHLLDKLFGALLEFSDLPVKRKHDHLRYSALSPSVIFSTHKDKEFSKQCTFARFFF